MDKEELLEKFQEDLESLLMKAQKDKLIPVISLYGLVNLDDRSGVLDVTLPNPQKFMEAVSDAIHTLGRELPDKVEENMEYFRMMSMIFIGLKTTDALKEIKIFTESLIKAGGGGGNHFIHSVKRVTGIMNEALNITTLCADYMEKSKEEYTQHHLNKN